MPRPTFAQACAQYQHRYTMQHVPEWSMRSYSGKFYAPQWSSDREWYEHTKFPGEPGLHKNNRHCYSDCPTFPLGEWLDQPFKVQL